MKRTTITMVAMALLACTALAGCDAPTTAPANSATPAGPDPMEAKIAKLSEPLQQVTFFRAIQDAGYTCQKIETVEKRPRIDDHAVWHVVCDDQGQYLLILQPGGVFQVSGVPQPGKAN